MSKNFNGEGKFDYTICNFIIHFLSVKTNYEEFSNLKRIEKKIEKSSIKSIIGFDRDDMK